MSDRPISEKDAAEAIRRAEWLHKHKAHKDWIILSVSEVAVIRGELLAVERELAEAREALRDMLSGWRYIRKFHGDLYGVGWDRAQTKAEKALEEA